MFSLYWLETVLLQGDLSFFVGIVYCWEISLVLLEVLIVTSVSLQCQAGEGSVIVFIIIY